MTGRRQFVDSGNNGEIVGRKWYGIGSLDRQRFVNSGERHDSGGRDGLSIDNTMRQQIILGAVGVVDSGSQAISNPN